MKKVLKVIFFIIIVFIFSIFVFNIFTQNSIYSIDSANITYNVNSKGVVSVVKTYRIRMLKPYRFITLYEYLKFGDFVSKPLIQTSKPAKVTYSSSDRRFSAKLLFSKDMYTRIVPQNGGDEITVTVSYLLDGVVEVGKDYRLLSVKLWNEDVDTIAKKVRFVYNGPSPMKTEIYFSGNYKKISSTDTSLIYEFYNIKPKQPVVFDLYYNESFKPMNYYSSGKSKEDLHLPNYTKMKFLRISWYILLPLLIIFMYFLIFRVFGKEYEISGIGDYYREIPFKDNPILVNSIVKLSVQSPDRDGINSLLLSMVKNGTIEFLKNDKSKIIGFKVIDTPKDDFEKEFLNLFDNRKKVVFKDFEREFKKSQIKAKKFYEDFSYFKSYVLDKAKEKNLLSKKGYYFSLLMGIIGIFNSIFMVMDFSSNYAALASLFDYMSVAAITTFSLSLMPFFLNSTIFGRWTKFGIEYYRKFKALERFLSDYSLISEKPPESLTVWEDYLIYATALGIGNKVRKTIDKLNVVEIKENDIYYGSRGYYLTSLYYLSSIGAPKSNSSSGGFGGTSAGGGFGGGGMSAG